MPYDHGAKMTSVRIAFAAFRYCLGGSDKAIPLDHVILWLKCIRDAD
jgi:hypothetical protein